MKIRIKSFVKRIYGDLYTPVGSFLRIRDKFKDAVLLESNDFRSKQDCFSFIGFDPIGNFKVHQGSIWISLEGKETEEIKIKSVVDVPYQLNRFLKFFETTYESDYPLANGLFGFTGFDAVQYFDTIKFEQEKRTSETPDMYYNFYRYILAFNHFKDEIYIVHNSAGEPDNTENIHSYLIGMKPRFYPFSLVGSETSNITDDQFKELIELGKKHCKRGDVFQIVMSRQFAYKYDGDEFNVYRVLRSINPSPYLFYFDFGDFKIFGSSPEAQMVIKDNIATVNPIAGTYRRTGDVESDEANAIALSEDPKENAEHIMLVDLARNDLGKHSLKVRVKELKEIHYYSHVIHLVSKVEGKLGEDTNPIQIFADTFPAGTLSGAPKYKAIELINQYENQNRGYYGGAIGFITLDGEMNQAILIRSFVSKNSILYYQAGAGVVMASNAESELQEVNNKLGALTKAIVEAESFKG